MKSSKEPVLALSEQGETNKREIGTLKEDYSRLEEENKRLCEALSEYENVRNSRKDLLDNISDFGTCVYRQWKLPKSFTSKIKHGYWSTRIKSIECEIVGNVKIEEKRFLQAKAEMENQRN